MGERIVLQAIIDLSPDSGRPVSEADIARKTRIEHNEVIDYLENLYHKALIDIVKVNNGLTACSTAEGRLAMGISKSFDFTKAAIKRNINRSIILFAFLISFILIENSILIYIYIKSLKFLTKD